MPQPRPGESPLVQWFAETIDCDDADAMTNFYATILNGRIMRRTAVSVSIKAHGLLLNFRAVPDYRRPTWPSSEVPMQSHFELVVEDPNVAAKEMGRLGARMADHQDPSDPDLLVLLDPAGHPFCLIRSSAAKV